MSKKLKTNALRLLDRDHIPYEIKEYEYDEDHLSGEHVLSQIDMNESDVYKTLVLYSDEGYLVCCIPVLASIDLKKLARCAKVKKVEMIPMKDLLKVTGYIRGGCSPVGMKKRYPVYFDVSATEDRPIALSAGKRGCQMIVSSKQLVEYLDASLVDVCVE